MICTKCNQNEVTSKITGELCTSCYFESKKEIKKDSWIHEPSGEAKEELVKLVQTLESARSIESEVSDVRSESDSITPESEGSEWDKGTIDLSHLKSDIENLLEPEPIKEKPPIVSKSTVAEAKEEIASVIKELESRAESIEPEPIEPEIKDCPLNHDVMRKDLIDSGTIGNCPNCDEVLVIDEDLLHQPKKITEIRDPDKKYCQSCIERGYGLVLATREWTPDYFICDDCFTPLINNILSVGDEEIARVKENPEIDINKPILNQFYDLLEVPEVLRIQSPEKVLNSRNDIFNYHAPAILNKDIKTIQAEIEQYQVMLFQIKIAIEPRQDYINRVKHEERQKKNLDSIEKGKKEFSKTGPSKVKSSQDQKMADTLYKLVEPNAEKRLKMYLDLQKQAREQEFKNRTGT